jgi:hypothetical protein
MVQVVKKEWHQVSSEFNLEFDIELLEQVYPDKDLEELEALLKDIESGDVIVDDIVSDAMDNDVDLEWNHEYDDWWTHRKGGYEVTYEVNSPTNFKED